MIILSMIETTLQGSFTHDQTKHVQNGRQMCRGGECPKELKLVLYEAKCLVEMWANEEMQWQLSAMGRKQNIWGRTLLQNLMTNACTMKQH